jgi:hypothetical protein
MMLVATEKSENYEKGVREYEGPYLRTPTAPGSSIRSKGKSIGYPSQRLVKARRR